MSLSGPSAQEPSLAPFVVHKHGDWSSYTGFYSGVRGCLPSLVPACSTHRTPLRWGLSFICPLGHPLPSKQES